MDKTKVALNFLKFLKGYGLQLFFLALFAYILFFRFEHENLKQTLASIQAYAWMVFIMIHVSFKWMTWKKFLIGVAGLVAVYFLMSAIYHSYSLTG